MTWRPGGISLLRGCSSSPGFTWAVNRGLTSRSRRQAKSFGLASRLRDGGSKAVTDCGPLRLTPFGLSGPGSPGLLKVGEEVKTIEKRGIRWKFKEADRQKQTVG